MYYLLTEGEQFGVRVNRGPRLVILNNKLKFLSRCDKIKQKFVHGHFYRTESIKFVFVNNTWRPSRLSSITPSPLSFSFPESPYHGSIIFRVRLTSHSVSNVISPLTEFSVVCLSFPPTPYTNDYSRSSGRVLWGSRRIPPSPLCQTPTLPGPERPG